MQAQSSTNARGKVPGSTVTLLTVTSKMPSQSFSLPAHKACPGAYYGEEGRANIDPNTICGKCYAQKGMYVWACVKHAQDTRFEWVLNCQKRGDEGTAEFVAVMSNAIMRSVAKQATAQKYFRVHDSGDLFSPWYTNAWIEVCKSLPTVAFWFPTRSWRMRRNTELQSALRALAALDNVTVRPSALFFNAPPPRIEGLNAGTTASDAAFTCPASAQNNECRDCRTCWTKDVEVSYRKH